MTGIRCNDFFIAFVIVRKNSMVVLVFVYVNKKMIILAKYFAINCCVLFDARKYTLIIPDLIQTTIRNCKTIDIPIVFLFFCVLCLT